MIDDCQIRIISELTEAVKSLLLIADPDWEQIDKYISSSKIFGLFHADDCIGLLALEQDEIKNLIITPAFRKKGLASLLLTHVIQYVKNRQGNTITVKTGNTSLPAIRLYEKAGFTLYKIDAGYFIRNYPAPIYEYGKRCKDQLIFKLAL